jgi:hypothetical protein
MDDGKSKKKNTFTQNKYNLNLWVRNMVRFLVLTAATMKMAVFWVVAACILVEVHDVSEVITASIIRAR